MARTANRSSGEARFSVVDMDDLVARLDQLAAEAHDEDAVELALRHMANLERAIEHRAVIGQATGILMERYDMNSDAAFNVLRRLSSEQNLKLYDVAEELVAKRKVFRL